MKVPNTEHTSRPWRIHELIPDFRLEDVWELALPGGPGDFPRAVELVSSLDPSRSPAPLVRLLFDVRWKLGALFGWDKPDASVGARVPTLRDRLPADLQNSPGPTFDAVPFTSLYALDDEFAAESANQTMHGVLHLSWVQNDEGGYRAQLAVYVKPNGWRGDLYMAAIKPFRYLVVYPLLTRQIEHTWRTETAKVGGAA